MDRMDKETKMPKCVGIIMDGNRRWAKQQGLLVFKGHRAGAEKLKEVLRWAKDASVMHVICYAFSTENWNRSNEEVSGLMGLLAEFLEKELDTFYTEGGVLHCVGDMSRLAENF